MIRLPPGNFFGTRTRTHDVPGIRYSENEYRGNERIPKHVHAGSFVCFLAAGSFVERSGTTSAECGAGSVIWHPEGDIHADRFGSTGGRCVGLEFDSEWMNRARESEATPDGWTVVRGGAPTWLAHRISCELALRDGVTAFALDGLACALIAELSRSPASVRVHPTWLDRAVDRLRAEFADPPSIALLAADAGVHRSHFVCVFHAHQRCTVGEFVRRQRVDWACAQLSSRSAVSISEVALNAGFADQAHFTRVFRRVTGQTPGQYRRLQPPPGHR